MTPKFHAAHYNAIAKEIREVFPMHPTNDPVTVAERAMLTRLAINLAKRFKADNERFDPLRFLDACSPNPDVFPLSELWEDE